MAAVDSLMIASTRDAVADLNRAARTHRIEGRPVTDEAVLADGNRASTGDTVITRTNNRRLALPGIGWVRNGARWTVVSVEKGGALTVVPLGGETRLRLPAEYVGASVQLGYASTIHGAQGVTSDTVHGLLTGTETRSQLYTLLTRGRHANHLYLLVDGAQNTHDLDRPDSGDATTPTEALERILERDGAARSAHSQMADLHSPILRLPQEIDGYVDALHLAIERTTDQAVIHRLDRSAGQLTPDLTEAPAWPALRAHLLLRAADGIDPERRLHQVLAGGPLGDARDPAAVLHYRAGFLDQAEAGDRSARRGPLPWLPHVPDRLQAHPTWGPYLAARAALVVDLAQRVGETAAGTRPAWAQLLGPEVTEEVLGQLAVWRAAQRVTATDLSLTGPRAADPTSRGWQVHLDDLSRVPTATAAPLVRTVPEGFDHDPFREAFLRQVRRLAQAGVDVDRFLRAAAIGSPLPDDHPSAALWWRLHRQLPAAVLSPPQVPATAPPPRSQPTGSPRENGTDNALLLAGLLRISRQPDPTSALEGPDGEWEDLVRVNRVAHDFYRSQFQGSWSADHLAERCGSDLSTDLRFQPGHAPSGWTALVDHLRRVGVTEKEMLAAGLVTRTRQGRTVDRFRDRLVLPIWDQHGDLIGFVARRHPDGDERVGPKYLNTPTTALFVKGHHLYGEHLLLAAGQPGRAREAARSPVLVEGPLDAIAVSLAGEGRYVGLATLGTALTPSQAFDLAAQQVDPVQALDNDPAGRSAATRNFWQLAVHGSDPRSATMPPGLDPAAVLASSGAAALRQHLDQATSQGDSLPLATRPDQQDWPVDTLLAITAVRPPHTWAASIDAISRTTGLSVQDLRERLLPLVHAATQNPERAARAGATLTAPPRVGRPQARSEAAAAEAAPRTYPGNVERPSHPLPSADVPGAVSVGSTPGERTPLPRLGRQEIRYVGLERREIAAQSRASTCRDL